MSFANEYVVDITIATQVIKYNNVAPGGSANQIAVFTSNKIIIFYSTDRANLENPDKVEEIQLWLIEQLMICFKLHHGNRSQEYFRKLIDMFIEFRNITEEFLQTHKKWKNDPVMRTRIPALGFFLFEDD